MTTATYTPGTLVRARGREWIVLPDSEPDFLVLRPLGGSDDEIAGLPLALETAEPATFALPDPNLPGDAQSCRLLRDALRLGFRSAAGPFRSFGRIQVEPRPYQLVPLLMALRLDPVRLLIADDVGIGKTIEAALVVRELLDRGEIRRFAVLCPPHLAEQWQRELASKLQLSAELVLPGTAARLERGLGQFRSLFEEYPQTIVSLDYIKSKTRRDSFLRAAPELIVVDEAHTCADTPDAGSGRHLRHELLRALAADPRRHLLLVTATPHSGKEEAFRSLLALLDPTFADLPDDLSGDRHEPLRRHLARHLVQRRRPDIRAFLAEDTPFPDRLEREESYTLTPAWHDLYDELLAYAEETVADATGSEYRRKLRWWSVLALLRAVASSPAAAAATLRNRARTLAEDDGQAPSPAAVDEQGRATVLDLADQEPTDVVPPCHLDDVGPDDADDADDTAAATPLARERRHLRNFAGRAAALAGDGDPKLRGLVPILRQLFADGHRPIVFCRFIPTVHYLVDELRQRLPKTVEIRGVTGELPPEDRERRVAELLALGSETTDDDAPPASPAAGPSGGTATAGSTTATPATTRRPGDGKRILVATDCLSEGINLQSGFDAVVHYDLAWNPTRHEQREGRVDRYGQRRRDVKVVTYYGRDNGIDGLVLEVLIRKHQKIRGTLGISVPVPVDGEAVLTAVVQGALLRRRGQPQEQLRLDLTAPGTGSAADQLADLDKSWQSAAEREKTSRSRFAQHALRPDEVAPELAAARDALGGPPDVHRFLLDALGRLGATVGASTASPRDPNALLTLDLRELPATLRERLLLAGAVGGGLTGAASMTMAGSHAAAATPLATSSGDATRRLHRLRVATTPAALTSADANRTASAGVELLHRTHPLVTTLASWVLDTALGDPDRAVARRCGVLRTRGVAARTTLLLLRLRHRLATRARPGTAGSGSGASGTGAAHEQLLEEALLVAFTGPPADPTWLDDAAVATLLDALPDANVAPGQATHLLAGLLAELPAVEPALADLARRQADRALAAHARVREALARAPGARGAAAAASPASLALRAATITPQLPVDILGTYLFLPVVGTPSDSGLPPRPPPASPPR